MRWVAILTLWLVANPAAAIEPPTGAVIIPIDLEKPVIRVVANCEKLSPEQVLVDVGFSQHLMSVPETPRPKTANPESVIVHTDEMVVGAIEAVASLADDYTLVAEGVAAGDEFHGVFKANVSGAIVGLYVTRLNRREQLVVEIRPMYVLPSGGKMPLTKSAGMKTLNHASRLYAQATAAKNAVPRLKAAIRSAESEYQRYNREAERQANGRTLSRYAAGAPNPGAMAGEAARRGRALDRQLQKANDLAARLPVIKRDADATVGVAKYSAAIAGKATIFVRLYNGDTAIVANVR